MRGPDGEYRVSVGKEGKGRFGSWLGRSYWGILLGTSVVLDGSGGGPLFSRFCMEVVEGSGGERGIKERVY